MSEMLAEVGGAEHLAHDLARLLHLVHRPDGDARVSRERRERPRDLDALGAAVGGELPDVALRRT